MRFEEIVFIEKVGCKKNLKNPLTCTGFYNFMLHSKSKKI